MSQNVTIRLLIKASSRPEPYDLDVTIEGTALTLHCSCPAGEWGKLCKHKIGVVEGTESLVYNQTDLPSFRQLVNAVRSTGLVDMVKSVRKAEKKFEKAQIELRDLKSELAEAFKEGA